MQEPSTWEVDLLRRPELRQPSTASQSSQAELQSRQAEEECFRARAELLQLGMQMQQKQRPQQRQQELHTRKLAVQQPNQEELAFQPRSVPKLEEAAVQRSQVQSQISQRQSNSLLDHEESRDWDRVVRLNIGGEATAEVLLSTLRVIESSRLASLFDVGWERRLAFDSDSRVFLDSPAEVFLPILNLLRECKLAKDLAGFDGAWIPPPLPDLSSPALQQAFLRTLRFFKLDGPFLPEETFGTHGQRSTRE